MRKSTALMRGGGSFQLRWRESLGIIVTVISAVALAFFLWHATRVNSEAGLDPTSVARERMAVTMAQRIVDAMQSLFAYQRALALQDEHDELPQLRAQAAKRINGIIADFKTGDAASISPGNHVNAIATAWKNAATAKPGADAEGTVRKVIFALESSMGAMEDASNLTYDPSSNAQNLADIEIIELPFATAAIARMQTLSDLAIQNHGMSFADRLGAANSASRLRNNSDISTVDYVPSVARSLAAMMPERAAELNRLPRMADTLYDRASAYGDLISKNVLLQPSPLVTKTQVDAASNSLMRTTIEDFKAFGSALDASLARRGAIQTLRNRYYYLALIFGAVLLIGVMITIAQLVAVRDRRLLREAQQESARLTAELARQHAEEALRLSEAQFRAVFDGAAVGIAVVDRTGQLVDANDVFRTMFGDAINVALDGHEHELASLLAGERETFEFEQHITSTTGHEIWTDATVSIVNGPANSPLFAICMFRDKTELKHSERRMQHDKTHDALTGLPNRHLFEEHLGRRFAEASALLDSFFAVLFVDLEHFKDVNESMGHAAGDLVLTQIAQRMRSSVDGRDVVARLGGDEFAILVQSLGDILHVESIARRVLNNLSKAIGIGPKSVYLGANVGIAIGSSNYERAEDVMRDAEIAMQHAKGTGGTRYAVFDSKMHLRAQKRLELTTDLRLAIERNEFRLLYQPIVSIHDSRPIGCEALIRWDHPTEGVLSPSEFIPLAEQTGLAVPIGRFVLKTAAEQLAAWRRVRPTDVHFTMHVNVSAAELLDPDFDRNLMQIIEQNGVSPRDFTIEITENVVLDAGTRANVTLEKIRERGFKICIDDFGTGYSSLRYLQQFKVDSIKIDRSFVAGTDGELASEPIVRTLMTLAEAFDVTVVAEGVETARQRELLRNAGCRLAQGYYYARALSGRDMLAFYPNYDGRQQRTASA